MQQEGEGQGRAGRGGERRGEEGEGEERREDFSSQCACSHHPASEHL